MSHYPRPATSMIAILGALASAAVFAQGNYPAKPIRMILPYATGGSASALARAIADDMQATLGQPVIVESRPGANSMTGAEIVAQAPNDGYTILYLGWPTIGTNLVVYKNVRYKLEDFQPITTIFRSPVALTVKKELPVANLKELFDYARKQGGLSYGTSGAGSSPHLLMTRLSQATGVKFEHVPYKGEAPAVTDVLGGHLPMFAGSIATPAQQIRAGALKVVAVSSPDRLVAFPDVATFREAGFDEHVFTYWHGFAAPAGTPRPIINRLHTAIVGATTSKGFHTVLGPDQIVTTMSPDDLLALIRKDIATWGPVIRANNLTE